MLINFIDPHKIILDDNSEWQPTLSGREFPPSWKKGDEVLPPQKGGKFSVYRMINITREKQEVGAVPAGVSGGIAEPIKKGLKIYPRENLDKNWRIKELYDDGSLLLEDGSEWHLSELVNKDVSEWVQGQYVCISKGNSELDFYRMKNLKIDKSLFLAKFLGFRE